MRASTGSSGRPSRSRRRTDTSRTRASAHGTARPRTMALRRIPIVSARTSTSGKGVAHAQTEPFRIVIASMIVAQSSVVGGRFPLSPQVFLPVASAAKSSRQHFFLRAIARKARTYLPAHIHSRSRRSGRDRRRGQRCVRGQRRRVCPDPASSVSHTVTGGGKWGTDHHRREQRPPRRTQTS